MTHTPVIQNNLTNATCWLNQEEISTLVTKGENLDIKWIRNMMIDVQMLIIRPCLGNALYNDIINQIQTATITPNYEILRQEFGRAVAYYTMAESVINGMRLRFMNIGLTQNIDNTANNSDKYDASGLRSQLLHSADGYKALALEWLIHNKSTYPLFPQNGCICHGAGGDGKCKAKRSYFTFQHQRPSSYPQNLLWLRKYNRQEVLQNLNPYGLFPNEFGCGGCG